ncbi:neutral/alkaline non-lysosomal ceramidase N-terminal domain-containing protein [Jiangella sp. DSM 45060]|uniref:neutral/alkaline non-lysosomal ceramidase N-terminal domain-containing protein n=1 Tax=Jiangella sp. DSM 45060 TaxID=1798224 RepID=UPI00087C6AEB|nr:neutral/alkaline non-lysosomal ceramidase N-terminal domain-containing protein [Jiangella sp. DSM 45060]SDT72631.1 Glycosidase [Jiangella sp. DSM 45060]
MTLRIGFGRTDLTPPLGVELAGFGPFLRRRATSVHAPLYARAVAVTGPGAGSGGGRWVLVSCDLLGVSAAVVDEVVARVADATGWRPDEIVVHATHNHSGPGTVENVGWGAPDELYVARLPERIAAACVDAVRGLAPATVRHAVVPLDGFAHNRMLPRRGLTNARALDGSWTEPDPSLLDEGVHVLRVDHDGALAGFVASYSCHPVICCESTSAVHGDYPGEALRLVEAAHPGATGVFLQGALGDLNPLYAHGPEDESMVALELFAGRFADAVLSGLGSAAPLEDDAVAVVKAEIPYELAPYDLDELRKRRDEGDDVTYLSLRRTVAALEDGRDVRRPLWVHALRLGPLTLLGYNVEVFHGIKRRLRDALGEHCLVLSTTNGWLGYAPTHDAYEPPADPYPAYEVPIIACHLPFRPDIEDDLVAAGVRAAGRLGADPQWWRGAVVYECHLPSFRDGSGDGIGDLDGLIEGLDYLRDLGVDAVWTGPFYRSPLLDQGFDVADYLDVEPVFGTLATFDRLIEAAHERGIRVIVDYIPNHTSDQHPWFVASRSSRDDPKRDWYVWRDRPNNWTSEAGGSVWEYDAPTGQYYLHSHLVEQPDLNWRNPEVRKALLDVLRFWLDRGADGVRIDVAHMLMKDPEFRDNPPAPGGNHNEFDLQHPDFGTQLHVHDRRHPDTFAALAEIRAVADEYAGRVTIAEIEAMPWADWAEYYAAGMHLPFPFRLLETHWRADLLRSELEGLYAAMPDGAWPIVALGNHDRVRLATRLGPAQARVAAVLLLTLAATPCLLYADELGLTDQPVPVERQRDYFARTHGGVSRDPSRTPLPWTGGVNGGFSSAAEQDLWLPVSHDVARLNVEAQLADPASMLRLYRALARLRHASPALRRGSIAFAGGTESVLAYTRVAGGDRKLVLLNLTDRPATTPVAVSGRVVLSTVPGTETPRVVAGEFELAAGEAVVIDVERDHADH